MTRRVVWRSTGLTHVVREVNKDEEEETCACNKEVGASCWTVNNEGEGEGEDDDDVAMVEMICAAAAAVLSRDMVM